MAVTGDQIQALYLAYFNRPADFFGLVFQQDQASRFGLQLVADQFSKSPEYTATYAGKTTVEIVDTIYLNLFGRHAEPAGMKFWSDLLNNPNSGVSVGNAALTIFQGAINGDKTSVDNKLKAANIFYASIDTTVETVSYSGTAANAVLKAWMSTITTDASLAAATSPEVMQALADAYIYAYALNDTSSATANVVTVDASTTTFSGGAGADIVTLSSSTTTKTVALNDGNDTLKLASGTTTLGANMAGGNGIDTLTMFAADAGTASATDAFAARFDGFEKLSLLGVTAGASVSVDLARMDHIDDIVTAGIANGGALALVNLGANSTIELTGTSVGQVLTATLADATGTADVLKLQTRVTTAAIDFGTVKADGVETIKLNVADTDTKVAVDTATLNLAGDVLHTLTIGGNGKLVLTGGTALVQVDGSAMTGALEAGTDGTLAASVSGGAGNDTLTTSGNSMTLNGGAGNDSLTALGQLDILIGGVGSDTFNVAHPTSSANAYTTIADAAKGDTIVFAGTASSFKSAQLQLADTAVLQDYANFAESFSHAGELSWFVFKGNTYVLDNVSGNSAIFSNGVDQLVKLTGVVDLSTASFSATSNSLLIA